MPAPPVAIREEVPAPPPDPPELVELVASLLEHPAATIAPNKRSITHVEVDRTEPSFTGPRLLGKREVEIFAFTEVVCNG
jgi:hypothetical protein